MEKKFGQIETNFIYFTVTLNAVWQGMEQGFYQISFPLPHDLINLSSLE